MDRATLEHEAMLLIDTPRQRRVLWVDDQPANNRSERAAFAKLQIEVVAVLDTDSALQVLTTDTEGFDLIFSDWSRPAEGKEPGAGVHLLRRLRSARIALPVVLYHGAFDGAERERRRRVALAEGAFGEAIRPDELLQLAVRALAGS